MRSALAIAAVLATGCVSESPFVCEDSSQCVAADGQSGTCESTGFCSFTDDTCESGRRYGKAAGDDLANECVPGGPGGCSGNLILTAGGEHTCSLDASGNVLCWGRDADGQLGDDLERRDESSPVAVSLLPPIESIDAGRAHTCAVDRQGTLYCWGDNGSGQVGVGFLFNDFLQPVAVAGNVVQVDAGSDSTCFVTTDGRVACMGDNEDSEVGNNSGVDEPTPVFVEGIDNALQVGVGVDHACARLGDGTVTCWGANLSGQIGDGTLDPRPLPVPVPGLTDIVEIAVGDFHNCARNSGGVVFCWGNNGDGELADGTQTDRPDPTEVATLRAERLVAGGDHTCAVDASGGLSCWGENNDGELGDATLEDKSTPIPVPIVVAEPGSVAAGSDHTCAQDGDGQVRCWGSDLRGQLGTETPLRSDVPLAVVGVSNAVDVAAASRHSCVVTSGGAVQCWGRNGDGELGDGGTGRADEGPQDGMGVADADVVVATNQKTCAHVTPDAVVCAGASGNSLVGTGSVSDRTTFGAINGVVASPTAIAMGSSHSCAIDMAGALFCWGSNTGGKLGDGTTTSNNVAHAATVVSAPTLVRAGDSHTCAVEAGALLCWGGGTEGQLGDGNGVDSGSGPAVDSGIMNPIDVALGSEHSCAVLSDATVSCWGRNDRGQVGTGTAGDPVLAPTAVPGLSDVAEIASDSDFTCARTNAGAVFCWGENEQGELGAGVTEEFSATPVEVTGITGATAIDAGDNHACAVNGDGTVSCWGDNTDAQANARLHRLSEPQASALVCQ